MFGYCGSMSAVDWTLMVGLWAAALALIIWVITRLFPTERRPDAVELLEQRLTAGDIDAETYRQLRQELAHLPVDTQGSA